MNSGPEIEVETAELCPRCHEPVAHDAPWAPWCPACDWNLAPKAVPASSARRQRRNERAARRGRQRADRLAKRIADDGRDPGPALAAAAVLLSCLVHLTTLLFVAAAVTLAVATVPNAWGIVGVVLLLGAAYGIRPRPGRLSDFPALRSRQDLPALFGVLDRIADEFNAGRIDGVVFAISFNASIQLVGWRRRRVLTIGMSLWSVLSPEERVAILGHEIAHQVNGDATNGLIVGTAIQSLLEWERALRPSRSGRIRTTSAWEQLSEIVQGILASLVTLLRHTITACLVRSKARAEYRADELGARVAGTAASVAALDLASTRRVAMAAVETAARRGGDPWAAARRAVHGLPTMQRERLRRIARAAMERVDDSHPTNARRVEALTRHDLPPAVTVSAEELQAIEAELAPDRERLQQTLRNLLEIY